MANLYPKTDAHVGVVTVEIHIAQSMLEDADVEATQSLLGLIVYNQAMDKLELEKTKLEIGNALADG